MKVLISVNFIKGKVDWISPCGLFVGGLVRIDGLLKWKAQAHKERPIYEKSFSECLKRLNETLTLIKIEKWQVAFLNRVHKQYDTFLLPNLYIDFIDGDLDRLLTWDEYESLLK